MARNRWNKEKFSSFWLSAGFTTISLILFALTRFEIIYTATALDYSEFMTSSLPGPVRRACIMLMPVLYWPERCFRIDEPGW